MGLPLSHVLTELLAQHQALREILTSCEQLAGELEAGRIEPSLLTRKVARLRVAFDSHNRYEDQFLRPVLGDIDAFGAVRLDHMVADHMEEHRLVRVGLASSEIGELRLTLDRLRNHLTTEERYFLSSKVLHDDLVTIESSG